MSFDPDVIQAYFIVAAFAEAIVLGITVFVLYKNFSTLKSQNTKMFKRFELQSKIEKYDLTLKFADWVKSELSDYITCVNGEEDQYLDRNEIKEHFDNIAENMILLIVEKIVFKSLMRDEIKKMHVVLSQFDEKDPMLKRLKALLDKGTF